MMTTIRVRNGLVLLLIAALLTLGAATTQRTKVPAASEAIRLASTSGALKVLVLGDSYSAGNGAGDYYGTSGCYRSYRDYGAEFARLVASRFSQDVSVKVRACSGATTDNFWAKQWTRPTKLYRSTLVAQQFHHVDDTYDEIFLTIGGNDLKFANLVRHCLISATDKESQCQLDLDRAQAMLAGTAKLDDGKTLRQHIRRVLQGIHDRANKHTRIVLLGYPYLEADFSLQFGSIPLGQTLKDISDTGDQVESDIVASLNQANGTRNFVFVPTKALFRGDPSVGWLNSKFLYHHHELYKTYVSNYRWMVHPFHDTPNPAFFYHPNPLGWHMEADLLAHTRTVLRKRFRYVAGTWNATAYVGQPFSASHGVTGGVPPYTSYVGLDGNPPSWLELGNAGRKVTISGTPTKTGKSSFTIYVVDGTGRRVGIPVALSVQKSPTASFWDVSCVSRSACEGVGELSGRSSPYAAGWDGTRWTRQKTETLSTSYMTSVDCVRKTWCMAVGTRSEHHFYSYRWNGRSWKVLAVPGVAADINPYGALYGVSCVSTTFCMASGVEGRNGGQASPVLLRWNGTSWSRSKAPRRLGDFLMDVSCPSAKRCVAVGAANNLDRSVAYVWTKSSGWHRTLPPGKGGTFLRSVSCSSASRCMAVGGNQNNALRDALVDVFRGGTWTRRAVTSPKSSMLGKVSCPASTSWCLAVGSTTDPKTYHDQGIARFWDGSSWHNQVNPPGSDPIVGALGDCLPSGWCLMYDDKHSWFVNPLTWP